MDRPKLNVLFDIGCVGCCSVSMIFALHTPLPWPHALLLYTPLCSQACLHGSPVDCVHRRILTDQASSVDTVLITHCHTDHIGAIIPHARMMGITHRKPRYYVPPGCEEQLMAAKQVSSKFMYGGILG